MNIQPNIEELRRQVEKQYPRLGINKKREIIRLFYEILQREKVDLLSLISMYAKTSDFAALKKKLLKRRFPISYDSLSVMKPYLPKLDITDNNTADISSFDIIPEKIYYESDTADTELISRLKINYPASEFTAIRSMKQFLSDVDYSIKDYNNRNKSIIVTREKYDFVKRCPCTKKCVCCDYNIFNLGFGCPYECVYCYLQEYSNVPGIILQANIGDYLEHLQPVKKKILRIGSGEFADSLVYDHITCYSKKIIEHMRDKPGLVFEFKTKSTSINNILDTEPSDNIVVSWSVNPPGLIAENEIFTAGLDERIRSAARCTDHGLDVGFHFDPIFHYPGWEEDYFGVIDMIFDNIPSDRIRWISLGTFRFTRQLKKIIENRFPGSGILNGELMIGFDGKMRYSDSIRTDIFTKMVRKISGFSNRPYIYLCMETGKIWEDSGLSPDWRWA